jgi:hypothetical protein
MTIKEQLLQEIESSPDTILTETLDFLRFLKTKEAINEVQNNSPITHQTKAPLESASTTGRSFLEHLKTIGKWEGDDLEECLSLIYASRGKAKFDYDNPFE